MKATVWEPVPGIIGPCADISFERAASGVVILVTMHFSNVIGLPGRDLRLRFSGPLALRWEVECPGFDLVPRELPKCTVSAWRDWTFPLLRVEGGELLEQFRSVYEYCCGPKISHFLLISMNDLVQIVARSDVEVDWASGTAESDTGE